MLVRWLYIRFWKHALKVGLVIRLFFSFICVCTASAPNHNTNFHSNCFLDNSLRTKGSSDSSYKIILALHLQNNLFCLEKVIRVCFCLQVSKTLSQSLDEMPKNEENKNKCDRIIYQELLHTQTHSKISHLIVSRMLVENNRINYNTKTIQSE